VITNRHTRVLLCLTLASLAAFAQASKAGQSIGMSISRPSTKNTGGTSENSAWSALVREVRTKGQPLNGSASEYEKIAESLSAPRLVGIGEATHGTKEVVQFKASLILAMARKGRSVVFLEENLVATEPVNDWLLGMRPEASVQELLQAFIPIYQTQEFAAFLTQAKAYNLTAKDPEKIRIYGVDVQAYGGLWNPVPALRAILKAAGADAETDLAAANNFLENTDSPKLEGLAENRAVVERLRVAAAKLDPAAVGAVEARCYANALIRSNEISRLCSMGNPFYGSCNRAQGVITVMSQSSRDTGMAENLRMLMDAKCSHGEKAILWAHNGHIGKAPCLPSGRNAEAGFGNLGSLLSSWLGKDYVTMGVLTGVGAFRGLAVLPGGKFSPFQAVTVARIPKGTLNAILSARLKAPVLFWTRNMTTLGTAIEEFAPGMTYDASDIGADVIKIVPSINYDLIVSFPQSSACSDIAK